MQRVRHVHIEVMAKFSTGSSQRIVDLRKKKPGAHLRALWGEPERSQPPRGGRRSPLRARRRRLHMLGALALLAALALGAYGVSYASYLPALSIQHIEVEGADAVKPEIVRALVESELYESEQRFISAANIFLYPQGRLEAAVLEKFPRIRAVHVSRQSLLATAITVVVEERTPYGIWCFETSCFEMDDEGQLFAPAPSTSPEVAYTFRGGVAASSSPIGEQFMPGNFPHVRLLLERLGQGGFSPTSITLEEANDLRLNLANGYALRVAVGSNVDETIENLKLVLSSEALRGKEDELEYIDLRFGNRVYYRLIGGQENIAD